MKTLAALLAIALFATPAIGQPDPRVQPRVTGARASAPQDESDEGEARVTKVGVTATAGNEEQIEVRLSGRDAGTVSSMTFEVPGMRASALAMTKTSSSGGQGNGRSVWTVNIDLDQYADGNGDVSAVLRPCCTIRPIIAIVVRSKGR